MTILYSRIENDKPLFHSDNARLPTGSDWTLIVGVRIEKRAMADRRILISAPNGEQVLWRYLELHKFLDFIQRRSLWFTRVDQFADQWEGELPSRTEQLFAEHRKVSGFRGGINNEKWKRIRCANCWFTGPDESAAMWQLYSKDQGIAIRSSIGRLEPAFPSEVTGGSWAIFGSPVQYVDYDSDLTAQIESDGSVTMVLECMCKRKSFAHEREYRLITNLEADEAEQPGKYVPVTPSSLVDLILVSPTAPSWMLEVVRSEVKMHSLSIPVERSSLIGPRVR